ncbi:hypothetical protein D3C85_1658960 [compost metagenome]
MSLAAILMAPKLDAFRRVVSRCRMPARSSGSAAFRSSPSAMAATRSDSNTCWIVFSERPSAYDIEPVALL